MDLARAAERLALLSRLATQGALADNAVAEATREVGHLLRDVITAIDLEPGNGVLVSAGAVLSKAWTDLGKLAGNVGEAIRELESASAHASSEAERLEKERQLSFDKLRPHEGGRGPDLVCAAHGEPVDSLNQNDLCKVCQADLDRRIAAGDESARAELEAYANAAAQRRGAIAEQAAAAAAAPSSPASDSSPSGLPTAEHASVASVPAPAEASTEDDIPIEDHQEAAAAAGIADPETGEGLDKLEGETVDVVAGEEPTDPDEAAGAAFEAEGADAELAAVLEEAGEDPGPPRVLGERVRLPHEEGGIEVPAGARRGRRR